MLEVLESRYRAEECRFRTVFGELEGYRIQAGRSVAEKIELQTRYAAELYNVDVLAIRRRVSRLSYSRRCAEASAVQAHLKRGVALAPGMEIGYVVKDAGYYGKLLEKAWEEARFVFR